MNEKEKQQKQQGKALKSPYDNQWTNNNTKYYPDNRERRDGPGGN